MNVGGRIEICLPQIGVEYALSSYHIKDKCYIDVSGGKDGGQRDALKNIMATIACA